MGWFSEQIEMRIQQDNAMLSDACDDLYEAVTGRAPAGRTYDKYRVTKSAMDELLSYYHFSAVEIPKEVTEFTRQLDYVLHPLGMMWREVRLEGKWYKYAAGAMLGRRADNGQTVALIPDRLGGYSFMDAQSGKRIHMNRKNAGLIDTMAICVYMPFPQKKLRVSDLAVYILHNISIQTVCCFLAATALIMLMGIMTPKITYLLYTNVIETRNMSLLFSAMIFLICVGISSTLVNVVKTLLSARLNGQLDISVQAATMERLLSMPVSFFKDYSSGELANRMSCINTLCSTMVSEVFSVSITSVFSLIYVTQIFRYARSLLVPSLLISLVTVAYTMLLTLREIGHNKKKMEIQARNAGMVLGIINGIQKIKLAGAEKRVFARWVKNYSEEAKLEYHPPKLLMHRSDFSLLISLTGQFILYYMAVSTSVSAAEYGAFMSSYAMVSGAFLSLVGVAATAASVRPILDMARSIMDTVPETSEKNRIVRKLGGSIELNNVSFQYAEDMPKVIDNLTLKIRKGEYTAIVGKTGCGKSTLVRLLLGFEKPQCGAVYYDGQDMQKLDQQSLRQSIGTVMQDGKLFAGDIFTNITIAAPGATLEDAWEAAEKAGLAEDIRRMPMGMHTVISEGGGGISGGQRQRILIARAIAPKPKILIMDEATSALDNITQKQVSEALDSLKCTRIVIAHRLSTIRQCHRILYLEDGRVAEEGTYDELVSLNGKFADLVRRQMVTE